MKELDCKTLFSLLFHSADSMESYNSSTPALPSLSIFFHSAEEHNVKVYHHSSCLLLLALTKIIYTPAYWNHGEKEQKTEKGRRVGLFNSFRFA